MVGLNNLLVSSLPGNLKIRTRNQDKVMRNC